MKKKATASGGHADQRSVRKRNGIKRSLRWISVLLAALLLAGSLPAALAADAAAAYDNAGAEVFGVYSAYSTYAAGETIRDSFRWSDHWFEEAPSKRNDSLALLSMQLVAAAVKDEENGAGAGLLRALGFDSVGFTGFKTGDPDDCAYTWARKTVGDCTLVAIAVQSHALDAQTKVKGWKQNFIVNGDTAEGEHFALGRAAEKVVDGIAALGGGGKVKYWITGQSRGGALANLIAAKLPDRLDRSGAVNAGVYAYTFEAPATVDAAAVPDNAVKYGYIHNYVCSDDPVTKVPVWGMIRYGVDCELKTEETDAGLREELERLGSPAAAAEDAAPYEAEMTELIRKLEAQVSAGPAGSGTPDRADYSRVRTDSFAAPDGSSVTVRYSYQEAFADLMGTIFSGELSGISADALLDDPEMLFGMVGDLAAAATLDAGGAWDQAAPLYWKTALGAHAILDGLAAGPVSLTDTDFYALLRLIGPIVVDTAYEPTGEETVDALMYVLPLVEIVEHVNSLTRSHHFDTLLARLKIMAPQPTLDSVAAAVSEVKPGDPSGKMADEFVRSVEGIGLPWLSIGEASWSMDGEAVPDHTVSYFRARLNAVGHLISGDFRFTVNGREPVAPPAITYADGVSTAEAVWEFTVGTPGTVTVSFDAGDFAEPPAAIRVPKGKLLRYLDLPVVTEPVTENGRTWLFNGWLDESGKPLEEIAATRDMTASAGWLRFLNDLQVSYPIPAIGEPVGRPDAAESEYCEIAEYHVVDEHFNQVEEISGPGEYELSVYLRAVPGKAVFALETDEYGFDIYTGTATVNGVPTEAWYEAEEEVISVYYRFIVPPEFTDVPAGSWFEEAVLWAARNGITDGVSRDRFAPGQETTRAQVVTMLWRNEACPEPDGSAAFADVTDGEWYSEAIAWAAESGVVQGYPGGLFAPDQCITREELVTVLYRCAGRREGDAAAPDTDLSAYTDCDSVSPYAREAMRWAVGNGIVKGTSETALSPQGTATRAQLVQMLYRWLAGGQS